MNTGNEFSDEDLRKQTFELFEKCIEGSLSEDDATRLNERVSGDRQFRKSYLRYMGTHAALHRTAVSVSIDDNRDMIECDTPTTIQDQTAARLNTWRPWIFAAVAASVVYLIFGVRSQSDLDDSLAAHSDIVATLVDSNGCSWGEGSLPTSQGAQLTRGKISLQSGLAKIRFRSGVSVSLEAPVEVELIDSMNCVLHNGTLVADVPPEAKGFRVETKNAVLVDQGTSFGVIVDRENGMTDVQVFDGIVDVEQRTTQKKQRMLTGERSIIEDNRFDVVDSEADDIPTESKPPIDEFQDAITITTREGLGREGYVMPIKPKSGIFERRLVVKTSNQNQKFNSKAYLAFDLSSLEGKNVSRALFQLNAIPSSRGYASLVPDAKFNIYGMVDEGLDDWDSATLNWDDAPANADGASVDESLTVLLGSFVIPQGHDNGFFTIESDELVEILSSDTNGIVTLLIVRETSETHPRGLAHTFARSSTHNGVAPTLRVLVDQLK